MELQFETLDYQTHAIQAAVDLFIGQPNQQTEFGLKAQNDMRFVANLPLQINDEQLQQNLAKQQNKFNFYRTLIEEQGRNFTVEMETGTGKTYVYLRTIFELNRQYGWQKFVIVVPSVPIREGVLHTLETTHSHFATLFDNPSVNPKYEYKSNQLSRLKAFATGNHIEILVMNIDAFAKESNVINTLNESGDAPIRYIQNVNPIVIIDEPQNMETDIRRHAIASLNPLFTLRYSATHKNAYNPIFSLNPVLAYELGLVKQIEVDSVLADNDVNGAYVALKEINAGAKSWSAKVEILVNDKSMKKKVVTVKPNQDLFDLSIQNEVYRTGYILEGMNVEEQQIQFSGGLKVTKGVDNSLLKDDIQKM